MRMRAFVVLALVLMCGCDRFRSPAHRIDFAEQQLAAGNYGAAIVELRNVIAKDASNARAQTALAEAGLQTGDLESADRALAALTQTAGDGARLADLRARRQLLAGEFEALLTQLDNGEIKLAEPQRLLYRAQALTALRRFPEAIELFKPLATSAVEPLHTQALVGLAEAYAGQRRVALALRTLDAATTSNGQSALAWFTRGALQQQLGQFQGARDSWNKSLSLVPGQLSLMQRVAMLTSLGQAQLAAGDVAAARANYDRLLQVAPQVIPTQLFGARLKLSEGDAPGAAGEMQRLLTKAPNLLPAKVQLIGALLAQGNLEQANKLVSEPLSEPAGQGDAVAQGPASAAAARWQTAQRAIRAAVEGERGSESSQMAIGVAQYTLDLPEAARTIFAGILAKNPGSLEAGQALTRMELNLGRGPEALAVAMKLSAAHPGDTAVATLLGDTQVALRQYPLAATAFEQAWTAKQTAPLAASLHRARRLGGLPRANQPLEAWLATHPGDFAVRSLLAEALMADGDQAAAIREYERVLIDAPANVLVLNNLASLYQDRSDPRAEGMARKAYDLAPRVPAVADTYGWMLLNSGKTAQALPILEAAATAAPEHPDIAYHYAAALVRAQDRARARQVLESALATPEKFASRDAARALFETL